MRNAKRSAHRVAQVARVADIARVAARRVVHALQVALGAAAPAAKDARAAAEAGQGALRKQHVARVAVERGDNEDAAAAVGEAKAGGRERSEGPGAVAELHQAAEHVRGDGRLVVGVAVQERGDLSGG